MKAIPYLNYGLPDVLQVADVSKPVAGDDEVLICCSTPRSDSGDATCGEDSGVVLEL